MADFTSRFNELLTRTPDNGTALADALGVSKQTISAWKNGVRFPKRPTISIIANYFGVGVPWLQGVTDDEAAGMEYNTIKSALGSSSPTAKQLRDIRDSLALPHLENPSEIELIDIFRGLNDKGQDMLINTARSLATNPDMKRGSGSNTEITA